MAKITHLPSRVIIDGFKGKVDFYLYMGIPCARKWPVWRARIPHPLEKAGQDDFATITKAAISMPAEFLDAYKEMAVSTPFTWRDLMIRSYMRGLWL